MRELPPLDVHAHVATDIAASDLERLGAVVLIATKSLADFDLARERQDLVSVWGVGCHPALVGVQRAFDARSFERSLAATPYVAEVGLDGSSRVPLEKQTETLLAILDAVRRLPRLVSLHSYKATGELLDVVSKYGPLPGKILHWWLGDEDATARAAKLGCYFSVNYSMVRTTEVWKLIPLDRLLLETDHPSGDRFSASPRQPGRIQSVEVAVANHHHVTARDVRRQVWVNFARAVRDTGTLQLWPHPVRDMLKFVDAM
ncbi:putative deoxyribonuclease YcfH [Clavibacter michiganensis]|uniref:Putative deoxyribonuclease YcfH n=1 Tax=Clavibacter michiganensis TaxID=28447 RepID=A0A251YBL0_9MICO|nr:putative deoxyribonuclease YcfH [Clavibacter michiganensis]